jgi:hypothetical protein
MVGQIVRQERGAGGMDERRQAEMGRWGLRQTFRRVKAGWGSGGAVGAPRGKGDMGRGGGRTIASARCVVGTRASEGIGEEGGSG